MPDEAVQTSTTVLRAYVAHTTPGRPANRRRDAVRASGPHETLSGRGGCVTHDPDGRFDRNAKPEALVAECDPRIKYVIWKRRIASPRDVACVAP